MKFETLNKRKILPESFDLSGGVTGGTMYFRYRGDKKKTISIDSTSFFDREEVFNMAIT